MGDTPDEQTRRSVLSSVAATAAAAAGLGASGTAAAEDPELPIHASGTRRHVFEPTSGDRFTRRDIFVSPDVRPRNGGEARVEFETVEVSREAVPDEYKNPDRGFRVSYPDDAVLGSFEQHMRAEERIRGGSANESAIAASHTPPDYHGPLYTYTSGDLDERTAPVNVAWYDLGTYASEVKATMNDNGWGTIYPSTSKYIGYYNGYDYVSVEESEHAKKYDGYVPGEQWHGRLYNIPSRYYNGYEVVGAFHRDPADHGWLPGDENWRFADSRREASGDWDSWGYSELTQYVDNGSDFDSANGYLDAVY